MTVLFVAVALVLYGFGVVLAFSDIEQCGDVDDNPYMAWGWPILVLQFFTRLVINILKGIFEALFSTRWYK